MLRWTRRFLDSSTQNMINITTVAVQEFCFFSWSCLIIPQQYIWAASSQKKPSLRSLSCNRLQLSSGKTIRILLDFCFSSRQSRAPTVWTGKQAYEEQSQMKRRNWIVCGFFLGCALIILGFVPAICFVIQYPWKNEANEICCCHFWFFFMFWLSTQTMQRISEWEMKQSWQFVCLPNWINVAASNSHTKVSLVQLITSQMCYVFPDIWQKYSLFCVLNETKTWESQTNEKLAISMSN